MIIIFSFCRIHYVVGKACVKVWATKILSEFQNYLASGEDGVEKKCKVLGDTVAGEYHEDIA